MVERDDPDTDGKKIGENFVFKDVPVVDELHLLGGLRAGTSKGQLIVFPTRENKRIFFKAVTKTGHYLGALEQVGLEFIGHEQHTSIDNWTHSHWFQFDPNSKGLDSPELWGAVAHSAAMSGDQSHEILARKVSFALRASGLKLRDCSREYGVQNQYAVEKKIKPNLPYSNMEVFDLYVSLHSLLVEMCTVRDYLAQFISTVILKHDSPVDSMAKLLHKLKKEGKPIDKIELVDTIFAICDRSHKNGWMARLGEYRNIIAHRAPIDQLTEASSLSANLFQIFDFELLQIYLGIPIDPIESIDSNYVDALSHFRSLMLLLREFARRVATESGIEPKIFTITDEHLAKC